MKKKIEQFVKDLLTKEFDFYEFRSDKEIISFGRGARFETKPNLEKIRVLQLAEQTK